MPDALLAALTVTFVGLLYAFLWQVARSIRTHLSEPQPAVPSVPEVRVREPDGVPERVIRVEGAVVLGRSPEADVVLGDPYASELHTRLGIENGRVVLHDLGSTNGTFVNDRRVTEPVPLSPGDEVRIGRTLLEVQ